MTNGIKDLCGYNYSMSDMCRDAIGKAKRNHISDDREPEEVIESIKAKLRGHHGCNEPSGETVT